MGIKELFNVEEETEQVESVDPYDEELKTEILYVEDDLLHMMIDVKQGMMDYIRYEKKPLLENFEMDIWIECLKCCLEEPKSN